MTGKILGLSGVVTPVDAQAAASLHVSSARAELGFTGSNFGDPNYSGTTTQWMNYLAANRITALPLLNSYSPMRSISSEAWSSSVVAWCKQWCAGGSFWNGRADGAYAPRLLEIFNEPYGPWFRPGGVEPVEYARLLKATRAALDANGLGAIAILGAYADNDPTAWNNWNATVKANGGWDVVQGVTVHPYGDVTPGATPASFGWGAVYRARQDTGKDIYITEDGWPITRRTDGTCFPGGCYTQAQKDANIAKAIAELRNVSWIKGFWYYQLYSYSSDIGAETWGLYDMSGNRTVSFNAFQAAAVANGF